MAQIISWDKDNHCFLMDVLKCGPWNNSLSITWGPFIGANTQAPPTDPQTGNWVGPSSLCFPELPGALIHSRVWESLHGSWPLTRHSQSGDWPEEGWHCWTCSRGNAMNKARASWIGMRNLEDINQLLAEKSRRNTSIEEEIKSQESCHSSLLKLLLMKGWDSTDILTISFCYVRYLITKRA